MCLYITIAQIDKHTSQMEIMAIKFGVSKEKQEKLNECLKDIDDLNNLKVKKIAKIETFVTQCKADDSLSDEVTTTLFKKKLDDFIAEFDVE